MNLKTVTTLCSIVALLTTQAAEFHVAVGGNDTSSGKKAAPLRTIQRAAELAQPGDTITVHKGTYRERINPPRGGGSDSRRIVYQAAGGERVEIKGSEAIKSWEKVQEDVWKVRLPNSLFGNFNPYTNEIRGDWFDPRGRVHHTGAVYLNGEWLTEATALDEVLLPAGNKPAWLSDSEPEYLLNVAWLGTGTTQRQIPATAFVEKRGTQNAPCSEGGECVGFVTAGNWLRYDNIDFSSSLERLQIRAASATTGGVIEIRLGSADGELLGSCVVPNTGGWQTWKTFDARLKPRSGTKAIVLVFKPIPVGRRANTRALNQQLWFAQVDDTSTTIWAQFKGVNPNQQLVEANVRQTVFYPDQPGRNFITVRGFVMAHAATPWAPPTAEQIGLIGTHWSKGWIIEDNTISHSICSGIALGKHGDQFDNTSANTAEGYVKTIERAHAFRIPWTKENIGHHVVRNNRISHCEQAGIVGSLGAAFCTVSGNEIHDIHVRRLFSGAEMAGIKFHAAIDTVISGNHIYRTCRGLWLDWMAQGTRVTRNLFHGNYPSEDLFVEVDHGPFMVDNNLFLSGTSLLDMSEGGAYAYNLLTGRIISRPELGRETPYHPPHSTTVAGLSKIEGGDSRFYNNIFVGNGEGSSAPERDPGSGGGYGLWMYDYRPFPLQAAGNVYYRGARPWKGEQDPLVLADQDPRISVLENRGQTVVEFTFSKTLAQAKTVSVSTDILGTTRVSKLPYENPDGSRLLIGTDYNGRKRSRTHPMPGPLENPVTKITTVASPTK